MTALETAQRLGLSEAAVAAFTGSPQEFAQHFGVDDSEAPGSSGPQPPAAPTGVTVVVNDPEGVTVSFTPGATNGTIVHNGYKVTANPNGAQFFATGSGSPIDLDFSFVSGVAYTFTVTATNENGVSAPSAPSAPVTPNP